MPQDLPGFYFDPEKNRYFPIKGPIPGSTSSHSQRKQSSIPDQENEQHNTNMRKRISTAELLQLRELHGKVLSFNKWKCNFQHECQKIKASQPMIWRYPNTEWVADSALEQLHVNIQTLEGQSETSVLLTGSMNGSLSLFELGKVEDYFNHGLKCMPTCVWPHITESQAACDKAPGHICGPIPLVARMPSHISCIKRAGKLSSHTTDDGSVVHHTLITTLGSETAGGSVYIDKLTEPFDFGQGLPTIRGGILKVASLNCTIWTADCNPTGSQAVIGTNLGAALVNLENGRVSWLCRSKSDVFSLCFDQSGNVILCGFRNGAIVTVDVRQKPQGFPPKLPSHRIPYRSHTIQDPSRRKAQNLVKRWFELKGNINPSFTIYMPSSISSLVTLQTCDQYFLASSMDGSIKLYDNRLVGRGAIQSYEGHVNSLTRTQLVVDSSEELVMSGGEDGKVRIWCIKTGEMLFGERISNSVPSRVCWPATGKPQRRSKEREPNHILGTWIGSREGLFYMHGS